MRIISHIEVDKCRLKDRMCSGNNKYDAFIKDSLQSLDSQEDDLDLLSRLAESGEDLAIIIDQKDADAVRVLTDFADPELDKEGVEAALDAVKAKIDAVEEGSTKGI